MARFMVVYSGDDGRICSFFFKEAGYMQVQVRVLTVDPFTNHRKEKVILWGHRVGNTLLSANKKKPGGSD